MNLRKIQGNNFNLFQGHRIQVAAITVLFTCRINKKNITFVKTNFNLLVLLSNCWDSILREGLPENNSDRWYGLCTNCVNKNYWLIFNRRGHSSRKSFFESLNIVLIKVSFSSFTLQVERTQIAATCILGLCTGCTGCWFLYYLA